ncbi:MAG: YdcF family protein [Sphingobacteriaceae bacterium]|nr:YdcF family protein [Sphingobacteriaceae bacterium]
MFFILSKLLVYLIYPFTWIGITLLCALFSKNQKLKKISLRACVVLLVVASNPFLLNVFARYWDVDSDTRPRNYSCAIVLGGFVSEDADAKGYFNGSSDRFIQALKVKVSGKASHLLFSGGNASLNPGKFREARWIAAELKHYNIADSSVLIEKESRNTFENAKLSKKMLLDKKLPPPYLLVTSAFHMRRSLMTYKKMGLEVVPCSSNYMAGRDKTSFDSFIPNAETVVKWNFYIKEVIGYWVYYLKDAG